MQRLFTALAVLIAAATTAAAQPFPSRVITIVVPLPPGGASDLLARTLADHMKGTLGQPVIVENVAGAGGTLSVNRVARAPGDGYTLSFGNWATHVASAATYPVQYDILKDIEPVAKVADTPLWMVTKKALPVTDLKELIAWIKANQDKASAGIVGHGSGGHICGLTFQNATGTNYQFIPYKGGAPAMQDLVGRPDRFHVRHGGELAAAGARRQHQADGGDGEEALVRRARRADRRGDGRAGSGDVAVAWAVGVQGHAART